MSRTLSKYNNTNIPLASNAVFNGLNERVANYDGIIINIHSNQSSVVNGIELYFGSLPSNLELFQTYSYTANETKIINITNNNSFFRLIYRNGSSAQTEFSIQTFFGSSTTGSDEGSIVKIKDSAGNNLTSTSGALDVNIATGSISISSVNIKDSSGNNLNSTSNALNSYITNTSIPVTGTFYPTTQPVSGSVSVNTISGFALETGGNLASIKTNTDKIKSDTTNTDAIQVQVKNTSIPVTGSFYPETQPVSGTVSVNTISGFALETGGNLASIKTNTDSIKTNTDRIKSDTTNTDAIQVQVKNTSIPVTGTFYPTTQPVSGTVSVNTISGFALETGGNLASIKTNTDRIKSDTTNTDAIQVQVKNTSIPVTGSFYPETQPISGTVSVNTISGFALETGGNLASIKTNTDSIKTNTDRIKSDTTNTDAIQVQVKNTSIPVTGTFYPETQAVSGTVSVNTISGFALETGGNLASIKTNTDKIKSDTTNTDAIQVQVKNTSIPVTGTFYPETQAVSGTVSVNTISGFALETGGNLASIKTNTDRIKSDTTNTDAIQVQVKNTSIPVTGSFYPETQPVSGTVSVNTISGFATETTLDSIKTNTSRIKSDTTNTDAIQVQVKNTSIPVTGTFYPETQPISGSVTVNTISGFALETGGNLASIKTNTDRIKSDTTNTDAIQVQVKNTAVPVSGTVTVNTISGFATETTLTSTNTKLDTLHTDLDGLTFDGSSNLNVNIASGSISVSSVNIKDSAGNNLTSTSNALDVNVKSGSITISSVNVKDTAGNDIKAITTAGAVNGSLKTVLEGQTNNANITDTSTTYAGTAKVGLDVFIANDNSKPVVTGGYDGTNIQPIKTTNTGIVYTALDTSNNTIKIDASNNTISGTVLLGTTGNTIKIDTSNNTIKLDTSNNSVKITDGTDTADIEAMNASFTNKKGLNTNSQLFCIDVNTGNNVPIHSVNYNEYNHLLTEDTYSASINNKLSTTDNEYAKTGLNVYQIYPKKIHYTFSGQNVVNANYQILGGPGCSLSMLTYNFGIGANVKTFYANVASSTVAHTLTYDYVDNLGDIQTTSKTIASGAGFTTLGNYAAINKWTITPPLLFSPAETLNISVGSATTGNAIAGGYLNFYYNGLITIPNGYIGYISNFSQWATNFTWYYLMKWDSTGRNVVHHFYNNFNSFASGHNGSIGPVFQAGDTIAWARDGGVSGSNMTAMLILEPI